MLPAPELPGMTRNDPVSPPPRHAADGGVAAVAPDERRVSAAAAATIAIVASRTGYSLRTLGKRTGRSACWYRKRTDRSVSPKGPDGATQAPPLADPRPRLPRAVHGRARRHGRER